MNRLARRFFLILLVREVPQALDDGYAVSQSCLFQILV